MDKIFKMKKIFITGGGGYVGAALSDFLIKKNYQVTVYDLFLYGKDVFFEKERVKLIEGDIRNIDFTIVQIPEGRVIVKF